MSQTISIPTSGLREIIVDGHAFTTDLDDVELLRALMALNERIAAISSQSDKDPASVLKELLSLSEDAREVIERALGTGSYELLFGADRRPLMRALVLVAALTKEAGAAYDRMFAEYAPKD